MIMSKKISAMLKNKKTWLVTGAAGFIGSNLIEYLLINGQKVIALDNFSTGYKKNIDEALESAKKLIKNNGGSFNSKNFIFIRGDITDLNICKKACKNAHIVLHQAALGSVSRSIEDPLRTNSSNINGFLNMLIASKDSKVERFVFAASSSTYGDHKALPKKENIIGNPLSPYAVTKLVNELYADVFKRTYDLNYVGLRYFNVFGKRQDPKGAYAAVIPKWINSLILKKNVFINGDGKTSRDFCYIQNVIQINMLAALSDNAKSLNQIYNVAVGNRTSLNKLFKIIKKTLEEKRIDTETLPIYRDFRKGDVRHSQADISKAEKLLGYSPSHSLEDGLKEAMDWYITNSESF